MNARERLRHAIEETAYESLIRTGYMVLFGFDDEAERAGASEQEFRQVIRELVDGHYLFDEGGHYRGMVDIVLAYESRNRDRAYPENEVRRFVLREAAAADTRGEDWTDLPNEASEALGYDGARLYAAAVVLEALQYVNNHSLGPGAVLATIRSEGQRLVDDEDAMKAGLPVNRTEDTYSGVAVSPDVIKPLIMSCEQMLQERGWITALDELKRGDRKFDARDWDGAVKEYYRALESGLKYALHEEDVEVAETRALRKLAGRAVDAAIVPNSYQALFGFIDQIRSPVSHGGGPAPPAPIEIGHAEALLMGNHVRAALVYLGERTS